MPGPTTVDPARATRSVSRANNPETDEARGQSVLRFLPGGGGSLLPEGDSTLPQGEFGVSSQAGEPLRRSAKMGTCSGIPASTSRICGRRRLLRPVAAAAGLRAVLHDRGRLRLHAGRAAGAAPTSSSTRRPRTGTTPRRRPGCSISLSSCPPQARCASVHAHVRGAGSTVLHRAQEWPQYPAALLRDVLARSLRDHARGRLPPRPRTDGRVDGRSVGGGDDRIVQQKEFAMPQYVILADHSPDICPSSNSRSRNRAIQGVGQDMPEARAATPVSPSSAVRCTSTPGTARCRWSTRRASRWWSSWSTRPACRSGTTSRYARRLRSPT